MYWTGLKKLEEAWKATVETSLQNVRVLLKSPNFSKSQVIDSLLTLTLSRPRGSPLTSKIVWR